MLLARKREKEYLAKTEENTSLRCRSVRRNLVSIASASVRAAWYYRVDGALPSLSSNEINGYPMSTRELSAWVDRRCSQFGKRRATKPLTKPRAGEMQADGRKWALVPKLTDLCKLLRRCLGRQSGQALLVPFQGRQS